jgi:hypothetical protein
MSALRIGVLVAARIAEPAIVGPAHGTGSRLVTIAARDRRRAEAFAADHGVERTAGSYAVVVADPDRENSSAPRSMMAEPPILTTVSHRSSVEVLAERVEPEGGRTGVLC